MAIWKLTPLNLTAPDWAMSTYNKDVIVRARTEEEARALAESAFLVARKITGQTPMCRPPWSEPSLVSCERLTASQYREDGKSAILFPANG